MGFEIHSEITLENWIENWLPYIYNKLDLSHNKNLITNYLQLGIDNNKRKVNSINSPLKKAICFGAGSNLKDHLNYYLQEVDLKANNLPHLVAAADGSALLLIEEGVIPDVVMTDLDGLNPSQIDHLIQLETDVFVLAHEDNQTEFKNLIQTSDSLNEVKLCTQDRPVGNWINTLGFTDGDRIVSYFVQNGVKCLLLGYDLKGTSSSQYSKPEFPNQELSPRKKAKLRIAENILQWLNQSDLLYTINRGLTPGIEISIESFLNC